MSGLFVCRMTQKPQSNNLMQTVVKLEQEQEQPVTKSALVISSCSPWVSSAGSEPVPNKLFSLHIIVLMYCSAVSFQHSTETDLDKILNVILFNSDSSRSFVLVLLDVSNAFDTVNCSILLDLLEI